MEKQTPADEAKEAHYAPDLQKGAHAVDHAPRHRQTTQASKARRALLIVILLASVVSGCSFYDAGRTLIEQPLETLECFPECPSYTEPIVLRHPGTGVTVACGPYPYALYSRTPAVRCPVSAAGLCPPGQSRSTEQQMKWAGSGARMRHASTDRGGKSS